MTAALQSRRRLGVFAGVALLVALLLAFAVSPLASSAPDGLERVAADQQIDAGVTDHALAGGPLADYSVGGVGGERLSTGLAGVAGVLVTLAVGSALLLVLRRARASAAQAAPPVGG